VKNLDIIPWARADLDGRVSSAKPRFFCRFRLEALHFVLDEMRFGTSIPGQRNAYAKTIGEKWHFPFHDGIFDVCGYRSTT
jgi:hypothetical protein